MSWHCASLVDHLTARRALPASSSGVDRTVYVPSTGPAILPNDLFRRLVHEPVPGPKKAFAPQFHLFLSHAATALRATCPRHCPETQSNRLDLASFLATPSDPTASLTNRRSLRQAFVLRGWAPCPRASAISRKTPRQACGRCRHWRRFCRHQQLQYISPKEPKCAPSKSERASILTAALIKCHHEATQGLPMARAQHAHRSPGP